MEYLKEFGIGWLEAVNNEELKDKFISSHPRYPLLVKSKFLKITPEITSKSYCTHSPSL